MALNSSQSRRSAAALSSAAAAFSSSVGVRSIWSSSALAAASSVLEGRVGGDVVGVVPLEIVLRLEGVLGRDGVLDAVRLAGAPAHT